MTTPHPPPGPTPSGPPSLHEQHRTGPPPGWYPGPTGIPQWWDGQGWGPVAPPQSDNSSTLAVFAHLGTFIGVFLVPLVILLTEGKKNRFVKHHATEALNFAITHGIVAIVLFAVYIVGFFATFVGAAGAASTDDAAGFGAGFGALFAVIVVVVLALIAISVVSVVFTIIAAVKAGQRKYWRYPVCVRFVKGAATREEVEALNSGIV